MAQGSYRCFIFTISSFSAASRGVMELRHIRVRDHGLRYISDSTPEVRPPGSYLHHASKIPSFSSLTYSAFRTFPLLSLYPTVTEEVCLVIVFLSSLTHCTIVLVLLVSNILSLYPTVTEEFLFY